MKANRETRRRGNLEQKRRDRGTRRRIRKVGALTLLGGVVVAGGMAAAAPPAPDKAPSPGSIRTGLFADTSRALETREGYVIRAWKYGEAMRSILPLGRALNTYEAINSIAGERHAHLFRRELSATTAHVKLATLRIRCLRRLAPIANWASRGNPLPA